MKIDANPSLATIIAYARAGSLDHAWAMFEMGGHSHVLDDPAALAIKGRLLKDRALRAAGSDRSRLLATAADAYVQAADLGGATYPLINAATLSLLAGDAPRSTRLAGQVLTRIAQRPDEPETPYYRAATRAEALLLLGRETEARAALSEAIALAPHAWEDHASTIRQFALILAAQGTDAAWLEPLRPPRSLHFGGHMSFRADIPPTPLTGEIAAVLADERVGFGYGALAAGADILVAEALLARGAELHLVIPGGIEAFAALSVDPFGADWRRRFDAAVACAETVRSVEPVGVLPDTAAIDLADEIAMGTARINAQRLASEAVQLLVVAQGEAAGRSQSIWTAGSGSSRQRVLHASRQLAEIAPAAASARQRCLAALAIRIDAAALADIRAALARASTSEIPPSFTGEAVVLAFDRLDDAAACAASLVEALPAAAVGGHYGLADTVTDPFSGGLRLVGRTLAIALATARSAPSGSVCVSDDFAAALAVADARFHAEYVGELEDVGSAAPVGLFALRRL